MVPRHTFSLWNNYQVISRLGFGLGLVNRDDMFAAIDNTVVLPGYIRADAAVYFKFNEKFRLQSNLTNLFNRKYYVNADGNNNISPGAPARSASQFVGQLLIFNLGSLESGGIKQSVGQNDRFLDAIAGYFLIAGFE